jgi:polar amino acid transport system substrate-binding protein
MQFSADQQGSFPTQAQLGARRGGVVAAALVAAALTCTPARANPMTVPMLAQESVAPKWIPAEGQPRGMCADVIAAIEQVDPRLRFVGYERSRSLATIEDGLARGTVWAACALVDSPVRRRIAVAAKVPLYDARYRLAARFGDTEPVRSLDDLARSKPLVNTPRGSGYIGQLKQRGIEIDDSTGDSLINLRKTIHGHGRYTFMNESSMLYYIRTAGLQDQLTVLPAVFGEGSLYFWTSKRADPAVAPAIEAALFKLKAKGELTRIYARWTSLP